MTCIPITSGIVCISSATRRFHVGRKYIWMDYHPYCGPEFYADATRTEVYEPAEDDPLWVEFYKWFNNRQTKEKAQRL